MHRILFTGNAFSETEMEELRTEGFLVETGPIDFSEEQLITALSGVEAYILGGDEIATRRVIESATSLKAIAFYGAGYGKYVDLDAAASRGIPVTYTPEANAHTVAEFTIALILDAVKQVSFLNGRVKEGGWERRQVWNLQDKVVGVVGMGAIGTRVARILHNGFGMNIVYVSRTQKPLIEQSLHARRATLPELLSQADVISVHASYSPETVGMLGSREFAMTRPGTVLINTSRAELVDGHALYSALISDRIAVAAFDCYYKEPAPSPAEDEYGLLRLPDSRFIITPHNAFNSLDALKAMNRMVIDSVTAVFEGRQPAHLVPTDSSRMMRA